MSKAAAIHYAIQAQLAAAGRAALGLRETLGTAPAANAGYAAYTEQTARSFLANVALRLRADTPPYLFKWSEIDLDDFLGSELWVLVEAIAGVTVALPPESAVKSDKVSDDKK